MNETLKKGITIFLVIVILAFIGLAIKQYVCMNRINPYTTVRLSSGTSMNMGPIYTDGNKKDCKFFSL